MHVHKVVLTLGRPLFQFYWKSLLQITTPISIDSILSTNRTVSLLSNQIPTSVKTASKPKSSLVGKFAPLTLSKTAIDKADELLAKNPKALGLRIGVRTRGCNGLSYTLDYCFEGKKPGDEVVDQGGVSIFIDRRAQLTLLGTEMDYQEDLLSSQFVFNNPNIKGTCGCGESFNI